MSPYLLARKTKIRLLYIERILALLVHELVLDTRFYIFCTNDDPELEHGFEFSNKKDLRDFIVEQKFTCPSCGTNLNTQNIRVAFVKKELPPRAL
ncbi:hypothetical protein COM22_11930 [Bacillus wiedmannii]|nr:hypothetical protein COL51_14070 [Bacillus wiedmannii]PGC57405.1 hypothetical protein COM22_11930 [Bacillus wiedmannii]